MKSIHSFLNSSSSKIFHSFNSFIAQQKLIKIKKICRPNTLKTRLVVHVYPVQNSRFQANFTLVKIAVMSPLIHNILFYINPSATD